MASSSSSSFLSSFRDAVFTTRLGENGCQEYTDVGVGSDLLAMSQMVRGADPSQLCDRILSSSSSRKDQVLYDDVSDAIILGFVTRNVRGGKGERELSYRMFLQIWKNYPETAKKLLPLFSRHYGYWKDLLLLSEIEKESCEEDVDTDEIQSIRNESIAIMHSQFISDLDAVKNSKNVNKEKGIDDNDKKGPQISLLAKWLPRENSYFDKKLDFVDRFVDYHHRHLQQNDCKSNTAVALDNTSSNNDTSNEKWKSASKAWYRKQVSKLTSFLALPEVLLSAQRADEIDFHKVASKATLNLSKAFLNESIEKGGNTVVVRKPNDAKRQRCAELFVEHLTKEGLKGATLMPDEIVSKVMNEGRNAISPMQEMVLDAQWKDLWKNIMEQVKEKAKEEGLLDFDLTKMVPLADVSGSMYGKPMEVSIALGIGISEITHPAFRDMVLTFESCPKWHKLRSGDTIVKKVRSLARADWGGSTNFEGAYDEILKVCVEHNIGKDDVPSLIVFSDMQFNQAHRSSSSSVDTTTAMMHDVICSKFAKVSQQLGWKDTDPTPIVFWNLRTTGGHPVHKDTEGTVLLSGYSPSMLKFVMNGEFMKEETVEIVEVDGTATRTEKIRVTPAEVLRKVIDDPLYDPVREILLTSNEGALKKYKFQQQQNNEDKRNNRHTMNTEGKEDTIMNTNNDDGDYVQL